MVNTLADGKRTANCIAVKVFMSSPQNLKIFAIPSCGLRAHLIGGLVQQSHALYELKNQSTLAHASAKAIGSCARP